jgi:hypothetical protein
MKEKKKTLEEISASIKHYYDTITEEERAENLAWGEFASSQFVLISDEWAKIPDDIGCGSAEVQPKSKDEP